MYSIVPFSEKYTDDLKRFTQELRKFLVTLDGRLDEPLVYNTDAEVDENLQEYKAGNVMIFICEEDNTACGYIIVKIKNEDWEGTAIKKYGKIEELYVEPKYRGKGVSTSLVHAVEKYLKEAGITYMELSVMAGNIHARKFYEKMGLMEHQVTLAKRLDT